MAESEEELKSLLVKVKEQSEKAGLQFNIQKLRSWHPVHHFMAKRWEYQTTFPASRETCKQVKKQQLELDS